MAQRIHDGMHRVRQGGPWANCVQVLIEEYVPSLLDSALETLVAAYDNLRVVDGNPLRYLEQLDELVSLLEVVRGAPWNEEFKILKVMGALPVEYQEFLTGVKHQRANAGVPITYAMLRSELNRKVRDRRVFMGAIDEDDYYHGRSTPGQDMALAVTYPARNGTLSTYPITNRYRGPLQGYPKRLGAGENLCLDKFWNGTCGRVRCRFSRDEEQMRKYGEQVLAEYNKMREGVVKRNQTNQCLRPN